MILTLGMEQHYTASGTYTYSTTNSNGCDSTATLNLTINPSTTSTSSATSCDTYSWNGTTYTASGTYTYVTTNSNGCDSTATLNLTINPSTTSTSSATSCDTYSWNGTTYTASGTYTYSTTNSNGCDSTATLNLTINPSTTSTSSATSCDTYSWNGTTYTASGTYTYSTTNSNGCDSTATLNLTINNSTSSVLVDTACGSYTWAVNGQTYNTSGVYVSASVNSLGCTHIDSLVLSIVCYDCNGVPNGTAFIDSCGNCVGGNTGNVACIPFSPTVGVILSNTDCDSLIDLTINVSQDPNEPDISTSLFTSDGGYFDIQSLSVGDTVGSAVMSAAGGSLNFNTDLIVSSIISSNQAIIQSFDINTGLSLGTFTISNVSGGINILVQSIPDGNNVTLGNSSSVTFNNLFVNPGPGILTFTSTINSEIGDVDTQTFPFNIICVQTCPQLGDANCDNIVNLADLTLVINHWLQSTPVGQNGDVVGSLDGFVNLADLTLVINNWLQSTP